VRPKDLLPDNGAEPKQVEPISKCKRILFHVRKEVKVESAPLQQWTNLCPVESIPMRSTPFALPGGFFNVNKGLILAADNEAELAGVMAHEISHVIGRHQVEKRTKANFLQYGALGSSLS